MRVYLAVPYQQKDDAKARGARWDPDTRRWYAPDTAHLSSFVRWLPDVSNCPGPRIRLPVLLVRKPCYRCQKPITCVVGLYLPAGYDFEPSGVIEDVGYLSVEDCGALLKHLLGPGLRISLAIGPLEHRQTRPRPDGYVANTCIYCRATQGAYPLFEELVEYLEDNPELVPELLSDGVEVDFPMAALPRWHDPESSAGEDDQDF